MPLEGIIGASPQLLNVCQTIEKIAPSDITTLLRGASGTGKELVAEAIHQLGARKTGPFVAVNMAAIPHDLLESELFGHERGAFTGAVGQQIGKFEQSNGGTLFLDEIGDMPAEAQTRLLRALQSGRIRRVGGRQEIGVDVRIVAATNRDLTPMIADGRFREDLYYRLQGIVVMVPPLRERRDELAELVECFRREIVAGGHVPERCLSTDALDVLYRQDWPGNIRQLENAVERALALGRDRTQIDLPDLPPELQNAPAGAQPVTVVLPEEGLDLPAHIADTERQLIRQALAATEGNKQQAARLLGLKRTTLVEKARRLL